jgi:tRNA (adenine22-N1)-methyltransferase
MGYNSRIQAIKSLVPKGARLLDVGTDHAILPIELVKEGVISFAIASDVNPSPLNRAKEEIAKNNLSSEIETILSNGFENIPYGRYNCVAICGMGGHLIWEIIEKAGDKSKYCPLILQPMSYPEALRKKLFQNGYKISNEVFAIDNNKSYVIMLVIFLFLGLKQVIVDHKAAIKNKKLKEELKAPHAKVIATGGLSEIISSCSDVIDVVDRKLTLRGLYILYGMNADTKKE